MLPSKTYPPKKPTDANLCSRSSTPNSTEGNIQPSRAPRIAPFLAGNLVRAADILG